MKIVNSMKKNIAIVLAFLALAFIGCEKNVPYEPGKPATTDQFIYFPVSAVTGVELDPEAGIDSVDVIVARTNADSALSALLFVKQNTDNVFIVPDTIKFAAGELTDTITVKFDTTMQVGNTYGFQLQVDFDALNPYKIQKDASGKALSPIYNYEATLIKYEPGEGVWVGDYDCLVKWYSVPEGLAWHVDYKLAKLPSGTWKLRIINPYAKLPESDEPDEYGLYDAFPYNTEADLKGATSPANVTLIIDPAKGTATLEKRLNYLGFIWDASYGEVFLYDYQGAIGKFDAEAGSITFAQEDGTLASGEGTTLEVIAGFRFYFDVESYVADNAEDEEEEATGAPAKALKRAPRNQNEKGLNIRL